MALGKANISTETLLRLKMMDPPVRKKAVGIVNVILFKQGIQGDTPVSDQATDKF